MTGLPIEDNDVSRLVAHNYLKEVDATFTADPDCVYLRYVDDTVIFAKSKEAAEDLKRRHHMVLRAVGLNPNAAKSTVQEASEFEATRQREFNERINRALDAKDINEFDTLTAEWVAHPHRPGWDSVMKRLYSVGRQLKAPSLRTAVATHLGGESSSALAAHALDYLMVFDVSTSETVELLSTAKRVHMPIESEIRLARFFGDAIFADGVSSDIANMAILRIYSEDAAQGVGYAKALWLLALHKHGKRRHREQIREWATLEKLVDEQFRLHFMYVFECVDRIPEKLSEPLKVLSTSDIELTLRLCHEARAGTLRHRERILRTITRRVGRRRSISARYLPFLRVLLAAEACRTENVEWLNRQLDVKKRPECPIVAAFLSGQRDLLTG
jgi:hypothetical protein